MYTIGGITGVNPAGPEKPVSAAQALRAKEPQGLADTATFSPEAQEIGTLANLIADGDRNSQVRDDRIQQAKEAIREGTYRVQSVVEQVASILTPYV
jgi:anti-sigma28 factor (negative regulator of flagellin synthesis)